MIEEISIWFEEVLVGLKRFLVGLKRFLGDILSPLRKEYLKLVG